VSKLEELAAQQVQLEWDTPLFRTALAQFEAEGVARDQVRFVRFAKMRYENQEHAVEIPLPDGPIEPSSIEQIASSFHASPSRRIRARMLIASEPASGSVIPIPIRHSPAATRGSIFLLSLVLCASMMPVERLPSASWQTSLGLGFVSAVFDNIPLTALALHQGGYDWGFLAYAVGFGGSMIWFGSSAGVALASTFPQARSVAEWLRHGWHVALSYVLGFAILLLVLGWHPDALHKASVAPATAASGH